MNYFHFLLNWYTGPVRSSPRTMTRWPCLYEWWQRTTSKCSGKYTAKMWFSGAPHRKHNCKLNIYLGGRACLPFVWSYGVLTGRTIVNLTLICSSMLCIGRQSLLRMWSLGAPYGEPAPSGMKTPLDQLLIIHSR